MNAPDGQAYDVVHVDDEAAPHEAEVIQYLRPNGRRRRTLAPVGVEAAALSRSMVLTVEDLGTGLVHITARLLDEPEESESSELADNGPGDREPAKVLKELILRVAERIRRPPTPSVNP